MNPTTKHNLDRADTRCCGHAHQQTASCAGDVRQLLYSIQNGVLPHCIPQRHFDRYCLDTVSDPAGTYLLLLRFMQSRPSCASHVTRSRGQRALLSLASTHAPCAAD